MMHAQENNKVSIYVYKLKSSCESVCVCVHKVSKQRFVFNVQIILVAQKFRKIYSVTAIDTNLNYKINDYSYEKETSVDLKSNS